MIANIDQNVGELRAFLDEEDLTKNTIFIFTTDNGTSGVANFKELESHGIHLRHTWKGWKAQIHEGGHRVPFIVRWPARIEAGSTCRETICLNDFMATAAAITGADIPRNAAEDSNNILPLLLGAERLPGHSQVVNHDYQGRFAIRQGKWKLVFGQPKQLFDLDLDPKEQSDVASAYPKLVAEMSATLKRYQERGRSVPIR